MPFGAQVLAQGRRALRLLGAGREKGRARDRGPVTCRCLPASDGWFEHLVPTAGPGTLYRYRIDGEAAGSRSCFALPAAATSTGRARSSTPRSYPWGDHAWTGRPWNEAVVYELHVGSFTPEGTYAGAAKKLGYLKELGVTAIELMPLSDFAGKRNWGYDGVLPYAPDSAYGRPEDLKALIDAAHANGLMVLLDVVYNHFGPKGNYLPRYAPQFFTERHKTPWGAAIDFSNPVVRRYFVAQRPLLAGGVPVRRAALRRGACHHRRLAAPHPRRDPRLGAGRQAPGARERRQPGALHRARALQRAVERRFPPRLPRARHRRVRRLLRRLRRCAGQASRALPRRRASPTRARCRRSATSRAASRARTCRRPASSTSCRTTTRSATAPSANDWSPCRMRRP